MRNAVENLLVLAIGVLVVAASADRLRAADPKKADGWTPELIAMAGGVNLFGENGRHSPWLTWEELAEADPDVVIVAPCGFDLARTGQEMHWMTERAGWSGLRAVREGRVYLADGNRYFNRPGPRVVETLEALVEMLHPEFQEARLRGSAWRVLAECGAL